MPTFAHRAAFTQSPITFLRREQRRSRATRTHVCMQTSQQVRKRIAETLAIDLPRQYESPYNLDWGIYDAAITFDDPMTQLHGKLMYKGMILTIAVIVRLLFVNSAFELSECGLLPDGDRVRTVFRTSGRTQWGTDVVISGVDYFWFGDKDTIVRHESTWIQTPAEVKKAFFGR